MLRGAAVMAMSRPSLSLALDGPAGRGHDVARS